MIRLFRSVGTLLLTLSLLSSPAMAQIDPLISGLPGVSAVGDNDIIDIRQNGQRKAATVSQLRRLAPYLGQVATGSYHPNSLAPNAKQMKSRSAHIARDTISAPRLAFANSYASGVAPGAPSTFAASIEFPLGTVIGQVTWSGNAAVTAADGADTPLSDPVQLSTSIPRGALFYVRTWAVNVNGVPYFGFPSSLPVQGVGAQYAASGLTNDWTTGGTFTPAGGSTVALGPVAIVQVTQRPSICAVGDSITMGTGDTVLEATPDAGMVARSFAPQFGIITQAVGGESLNTFLTAAGATRRSRLQYCSHIVDAYGRNDFTLTAAQVAANVAAFAAQNAGKPFFQTTITPSSSSTDGWTTTGNQTTDAATQAKRVAFNLLVRSGQIAGVTDFFDVASVVEAANDNGIWLSNLTADGLHPSSVGHALIRQSRIYDPAKIRQAQP